MKHSSTSRFAAVAFAVLIVVLLTPVVGLADESFNLHIPWRGDGQVPPALVRIRLEFPPGTNLSNLTLSIKEPNIPAEPGVDQATVVSLASPFAFRPDTDGMMDNNDTIHIVQVPGTASPTVELRYTPSEMWLSANDRCNPKPGSTARNVSMTLKWTPSPGPNVTAYRMNTLTVGRDTSAGENQIAPCDRASRRVKLGAATIEGPLVGGLNSLDLTKFKGRLPLDVILVLDKSGSMASPPDGATPGSPSKWMTLRDSIETLVDMWAQANDSVDFGGTVDVPQDRLAVVFFSSSASAFDFDNDPSTSFFVERGLGDSAPGWEPVRQSVASTMPGGSTAMGQGIKEAIDSFYTDPLSSTEARNDPTIILMTDAIQNVAPLVTKNSITNQRELSSLMPPHCIDTAISSCHVPIQAFGFTTPGSEVDTLLNEISTQTSGHSLVRPEAGTSFIELLIQSLKGNSVSLLSRTTSAVAAGTEASQPVQVLLDGSVQRATIVLGWVGAPSGNRLDLEITRPDGTVVKPVLQRDGHASTVQSVDIPKSGPTGIWSIRVLRKKTFKVGLPAPDSPTATASNNLWPGDVLHKVEPQRESAHAPAPTGAQTPPQATATPSPAFPYHLSIYSVEGKLDYRVSVPSLNKGTGDTITLTTAVSYQGQPLTNLPANAIRLKIERPPTGLGTLLHDSSVQPGVLTTEIAPGGDSTTPYDRKLAELAKGGALEASKPKEFGNEFVLEDKGNAANGDTTANDGLYSARLADTSRPGLYRFNVTMDWDDPRTGRIHRIETIERVVKVNSDPTASKVTAANLGQGSYDIRVIPVDKFGNFYGPSSANPVTVKVTGGGNVAGVNDPDQTGEYIVHLENVPAGVDPHIVIVVDGRTIRDADLSELPGGGTTGGGPKTKFAVFLHFGAAFPHGNFNNVFDPGFSFNGGLEYAVTDHFSVEGIFGAHHFENSFVGGDNLDLFQFSGNGKFYLNAPGTVRPWVNFGLGAYKFDPGSIRFGGNVGTGLQFNLTPKFALEAGYNFHAVSNTGTSRRFSTLQGGFRFRF